METMLPAGQRSLPPVPRPGARSGHPAAAAAGREQPGHASDDTAPVRSAVPRAGDGGHASPADDGQEFVARLRGAAAVFAAAAGATSAVVREAVPPARHRRSRCRLVLRYADGAEEDLTFLGAAGSPSATAQHRFDESIRQWLATGERRRAEWLVPDEDTAEGCAVDITAWLAAR